MTFSFYPAEKKHEKIILSWFEKEHVKEFFYGEGLKNTLKNLDLFINGISNNGKYSFNHWIAYLDEKPLGFLMTSPLTDPSEKWYQKDKKAVYLDLLIGEEAFLGKGLSTKLIREFLLSKVPRATVLIDPEKNNLKAIHVYEKAGFKKVEEFIPDYNPIPHQVMRLDVSSLQEKHT